MVDNEAQEPRAPLQSLTCSAEMAHDEPNVLGAVVISETPLVVAAHLPSELMSFHSCDVELNPAGVYQEVIDHG